MSHKHPRERVMTSVQVDVEFYQQFKSFSKKYKMSFQKLADRSMHLYLTDDEFRRKIHNYKLGS